MEDPHDKQTPASVTEPQNGIPTNDGFAGNPVSQNGPAVNDASLEKSEKEQTTSVKDAGYSWTPDRTEVPDPGNTQQTGQEEGEKTPPFAVQNGAVPPPPVCQLNSGWQPYSPQCGFQPPMGYDSMGYAPTGNAPMGNAPMGNAPMGNPPPGGFRPPVPPPPGGNMPGGGFVPPRPPYGGYNPYTGQPMGYQQNAFVPPNGAPPFAQNSMAGHVQPIPQAVDWLQRPRTADLPAYMPFEGEADNNAPQLINVVNPLFHDQWSRLLGSRQLYLWVLILSTVLFAIFGNEAVAMAQRQGVSIAYLLAVILVPLSLLFAVIAGLWKWNRYRDSLARRAAALATDQAVCVIEVYRDRVIKVHPHGKTVIYFHEADSLMEKSDMFVLSKGQNHIVWRAQDMTPLEGEQLRQLLYRRMPPERRITKERFIPVLQEALTVPSIEMTDRVYTAFRCQPAKKRASAALHKVAWCLPFSLSAITIMSVLLSSMVSITGIAVADMGLLWGGITAVFHLLLWWFLFINEKKLPEYGVAIAEKGVVIESGGCSRFTPRSWVRGSCTQEELRLETPFDTLNIPLKELPDIPLIRQLFGG